MRKCVFCKTRYSKWSNTSFHRFPSELTLKKMWLQNMKASNWTPNKTDYICSKHFDSKCFITHNTRTALKSGSVPTLFEGLFEIPDTNFYEELQSTKDKSYSDVKIEEEELQPADFPHLHKHVPDTNCNEELQSAKDKSYKDVKIEEELHPADFPLPYKHVPDTIFYEELQSTKDKSYSDVKIEEESQPADFPHPYRYATCTSSPSQSMGASPCSLKQQSSKRSGVKRILSESMDSSTSGNLKSDLSTLRTDHDYESSRTPKKTRIQLSVAHDHQYESSPRSSEKSLHRTKRSLKLSNARVKALTQHVKRLKIKVTHLKTVINDLRKRNKEEGL